MIRALSLTIGTLIAVLVWNVSVFLTISEGWLKSPIVKSDLACPV
jgi:hypothetical protein